jgi:hypothetical protein
MLQFRGYLKLDSSYLFIFICNFSIFFGANGQKKKLILDSFQETQVRLKRKVENRF